MTTPIVDAPVVPIGDLRLLVHQDAITAYLKGLRRAKPKLFTYGSFDLPDASELKPPLSIPTPNSGPPFELNYRIGLNNVEIDIAPRDAKSVPFPNPFNLLQNQVALFAELTMSLASVPPVQRNVAGQHWRSDVQISCWLKGEFSPLIAGTLSFTLIEVSVQIAQIQNTVVLDLFNNVLNGYLATALPALVIPIANLAAGDMFSLRVTDVLLDLDSVDISGVISNKQVPQQLSRYHDAHVFTAQSSRGRGNCGCGKKSARTVFGKPAWNK